MVKIKGYKQFGGEHNETAALKNVAGHHGLKVSEAMLFGLGHGIGFVYWHMKCMPAPIQAMKHSDSKENAISLMVKRLGGRAAIQESGSEKRAHQLLINTLSQGRPVICWGDNSFLPYMASPGNHRTSPNIFVVFEADEKADRVRIADRGKRPFEITMDQLKQARGSKLRPYPAKNRMADIHLPDRVDPKLLKGSILDAVSKTADRMLNPPIKNLGLKGIDKWAKLVLKWPQQFPGRRLFGCLLNILTLLETSGTGGSGFHKLYARFLREAEKITGEGLFKKAALEFKNSATKVDRIVASAFPDNFPALKHYKTLAIKRAGLLKHNTPEANKKLPKLIAKMEEAIVRAEAELEKKKAFPIIRDLNSSILKFKTAETQAFETLRPLINQ